jgi:hypothetical protein
VSPSASGAKLLCPIARGEVGDDGKRVGATLFLFLVKNLHSPAQKGSQKISRISFRPSAALAQEWRNQKYGKKMERFWGIRLRGHPELIA